MPFGRHSGAEISQLPDNYLAWLGSIELRAQLREAVSAEINARAIGETASAEIVLRLEPEHVQIVRHVVNLGYKAASRQCHPDVVGGTGHDMKVLNAAISDLREQLSAIGGGA